MPTTLPVSRHASSGLQGRHVLIAMIAFFGVVFAVNGVLLWQAISTHSGLVADEPYRKGLDYNRRIDAGSRQQALGWTDAVTVEVRRQVTVTLADARGQPVGGMAVTGRLGRPSTTRHDTALVFAEATTGTYVAVLASVAEPGAWLVSIDASPPDATRDQADRTAFPVYRLKRRLWLKP